MSANNRFSPLYLQQEADGAFAGSEQQLVEADTQHLTFQSVPYSITHTQLITHLLQSRVPVCACTHTHVIIVLRVFIHGHVCYSTVTKDSLQKY